MNDVEKVLIEVSRELSFARSKHPPFASAHEGYAVLLEEADELWDAIKAHQPQPIGPIYAEAIQVAAMAVRLILDCCMR